jgi:hypothetical protein
MVELDLHEKVLSEYGGGSSSRTTSPAYWPVARDDANQSFNANSDSSPWTGNGRCTREFREASKRAVVHDRGHVPVGWRHDRS